jgi:Domain of unknown function (DUF4265)
VRVRKTVKIGTIFHTYSQGSSKTNSAIHPNSGNSSRRSPLENPDMFVLKSIPFFARGLSYDDEVAVTTSPEGYFPVIQTVVKRSGYSTIRLMINVNEDKDKLIDFFTNTGSMLEFDGQLVALAIPKDQFEKLSQYIVSQKEEGRWGAEDGFLIIDA